MTSQEPGARGDDNGALSRFPFVDHRCASSLLHEENH
jgi:hypothetical protein